MGQVNTGAELVYGGPTVPVGKATDRIKYERIDGRGIKLTRPEINPEVIPFIDGGNGVYTVAITNANQVFQLPVPGDEYTIICNGNTAFCRCGGAGVVATTAVGGYDFPVADAIYFRCRPPLTHIGFLGNATAGAITFLHHRTP
jgi:hypothetical protein